MRIPFLQVHQSAWPRARTLAGLLRIHRREALGLALDLWCWALELSPEEEITGIFQDAAPAEFLAAGLEWTGDPEALLAGLVRAGFVEIVAGGFRVRGLDLYAEILEDRRKDRARKAAALARTRTVVVPTDSSGIPAESTRQTQTQTQTQTQIETPPPPAGDRARERAGVVVGEVETASLWEAMQVQREEAGEEREAHRPRKFRAWHLELRRAGHEDDQALRGHHSFLRDPTIRARGHPTAVYINPEVWVLRLPPPHQRPARPEPAAEPRAAAAWGGLLAQLGDSGRTYAVQWLERLMAIQLEGDVLTVVTTDALYGAWVRDTYGPLLETAASEAGLLLQLRMPGPAPPVLLGGVERLKQAEDERHATAAEVLHVVRNATGGG